jgi:chemotaxis signal transduction protein
MTIITEHPSHTTAMSNTADSPHPITPVTERSLILSIGDLFCTLNLSETEAVLNIPFLTPIPQAKPYVLGVAYLMRNIVTVIDIGVLFQLRQTPLSKVHQTVILIATGGRQFALCADLIHHVSELSTALLPISQTLPSGILPFIRGQRMDGEQAYCVLDLTRILIYLKQQTSTSLT